MLYLFILVSLITLAYADTASNYTAPMDSSSTNSSTNSTSNMTMNSPGSSTINPDELFQYNCSEPTIQHDEIVNSLPTVVNSSNGSQFCIRGFYRPDVWANLNGQVQFEFLLENYCANLQPNPISCNQFMNAKHYDDLALGMYKQLYVKYQVMDLLSPTADCLGIARAIFCAYQFNYCDIQTGVESPHAVCTFLCDAWTDRCPNEKETFKLLCSNSQDTNCAYAQNKSIMFTLIMVCFYFILLVN